MRADPLPSEEEERILAEVRRQLENENSYLWLVGRPVPPGWKHLFEDTSDGNAAVREPQLYEQDLNPRGDLLELPF